ncbi:MAG: MlaD family protein, partial [Pseudomonadota bacterium]
MSDASDRPAQPVAEEEGGRLGRLISAVWLVPVVALLIALGIAWQSYSDRGELISIAFPDASGIEVGQTTLRYREVAVGVVEDVGFSSDLQQVNVYVRVNRSIAPYLDESASFWIVQPEVTTRGVQGLNTILSGTYIQGTWDNEPGTVETAFTGAARAPVVPPGVQGTAIVLRARDSARLGPGAPILYRGIEVGEVAEPRLSPDGTEIRIDAFVRSPYD